MGPGFVNPRKLTLGISAPKACPLGAGKHYASRGQAYLVLSF